MPKGVVWLVESEDKSATVVWDSEVSVLQDVLGKKGNVVGRIGSCLDLIRTRNGMNDPASECILTE